MTDSSPIDVKEPETKKLKAGPDTDSESADSSSACDVPSTDTVAEEKVEAGPTNDPSDELEEKVDATSMDGPSDKENEGDVEVAKSIEVVDSDNVAEDTANALLSQ